MVNTLIKCALAALIPFAAGCSRKNVEVVEPLPVEASQDVGKVGELYNHVAKSADQEGRAGITAWDNDKHYTVKVYQHEHNNQLSLSVRDKQSGREVTYTDSSEPFDGVVDTFQLWQTVLNRQTAVNVPNPSRHSLEFLAEVDNVLDILRTSPENSATITYGSDIK